MNQAEVLEELYERLPNKEADELIDLVLSDDSNISKAVAFLSKSKMSELNITPYDFFAGINGKPIYKTVAKFMNGELNDVIQVLKMLSSLLTQIFIQCELRGLNPGNFCIKNITDVINKISQVSELDISIADDVKNIIIGLGWNVEKE